MLCIPLTSLLFRYFLLFVFQVFRCFPTDSAHTFEQLRNFVKEESLATKNPDQAMTLLAKVKGHLVMMPLTFLKDQPLIPKNSLEGMLPVAIWI